MDCIRVFECIYVYGKSTMRLKSSIGSWVIVKFGVSSQENMSTIEDLESLHATL